MRLREVHKCAQKITQLIWSRTLVFLFQIPCCLHFSADTTCWGHRFAYISLTHFFSMPAASAPASTFFHCGNIILWGFPSLAPALLSSFQGHGSGCLPPINFIFLCKVINDINTNQKKRKIIHSSSCHPMSHLFSFLCSPFQGLGLCIHHSYI